MAAESHHELAHHLETCPSCRTEIESQRRLRVAVRGAFTRATDLEMSGEFRDRLRDQLRAAAGRRRGFAFVPTRWLALAAGIVLAAGVSAAILLTRSPNSDDAQANDAIGDHRNCALKYRLVRTPVPLEEAAREFDTAYRVLISAPPDDIPTPGGLAHVVERHSCAYGNHRFGHVILQYQGRVVSLLVTANDTAADPAEAAPHVIGRTEGLSVVSVNGSRHAVMLVSDLEERELTQLAGLVTVPLADQLATAGADPSTLTAGLFIQRPPAHEIRTASRALKSVDSY
jgi:hypothetical protein